MLSVRLLTKDTPRLILTVTIPVAVPQEAVLQVVVLQEVVLQVAVGAEPLHPQDSDTLEAVALVVIAVEVPVSAVGALEPGA